MSISKTGIPLPDGQAAGHILAVSSGSPQKMVKRVGRRAAGKVIGKTMRKLFKYPLE